VLDLDDSAISDFGTATEEMSERAFQRKEIGGEHLETCRRTAFAGCHRPYRRSDPGRLPI
jgi:hypothetical protein